ncbi:amino acid permease [Teladorsagia circumcincta]|uniref:Amino acid permease n=1 Tax=Teladorsagia circumcincta TaxID=45464 RepID=A0A2G9TZ51_TELCI|nr:amino acid permease [Teladorsagia circumcincta]
MSELPPDNMAQNSPSPNLLSPDSANIRRRIMDTGRRFSTVTQLDPETLETVKKRSGGLDSVDEEPAEERRTSRKFTATLGHLALYKPTGEEDGQPASFISGYTTPGPKERATSHHKKANLGVLLGVYLPTIQHILGVTMFIRLFWVVGMAGLYWTMVLLAICCLCTLLTSISLSAVATNGVVESGGAYFIISRNLGAEFGSAVGILFYLANTVAASMYIVGGVEVLLMYIVPDMAIGGREALHDTDPLGPLYNNYRIYGTLFLLIQVAIVAMGVKFVQLLAPVVTSTLHEYEVMDRTPRARVLRKVDAVKLPGDLRDPQRSIPSGTIAATVTTSIIYYALAVLFAASIDRSVLRDKFGRSIDNNMVVSTLAWPSPWVVTVGSFLSTFGAALQCLCSAPRLLQSIAKDDVIPILAPFARVTANNEPLLGLLLTTFIAELAILLGAVDKIAEVRGFRV